MMIMIGVPCMETIPVDTIDSLFALKRKDAEPPCFWRNSLVYLARDGLAQMAIKAKAEYLLFVDSDMVFDADSLNKLLKSKKDIITGLCFKRKPPYAPCIYFDVQGREDGQIAEAMPLMRYPKDGPFEVAGCGMAFCLIKVSVLKDILEKEKGLFEPMPGLGEDLAFCQRATRCGYTIWCDPNVKIGHISNTIIIEEYYEKWRAEQC